MKDLRLCNKCLTTIDKDEVIPYFAKQFEWSKVGEFILCDSCIEELLSNWMYAHLNNEGQVI